MYIRKHIIDFVFDLVLVQLSSGSVSNRFYNRYSLGMAHNMHIFIVKLSNSLLRRILVIVIVEWSGNSFQKMSVHLTILCIANGASVEEFHLIIL